MQLFDSFSINFSEPFLENRMEGNIKQLIEIPSRDGRDIDIRKLNHSIAVRNF